MRESGNHTPHAVTEAEREKVVKNCDQRKLWSQAIPKIEYCL